MEAKPFKGKEFGFIRWDMILDKITLSTMLLSFEFSNQLYYSPLTELN